MLIVFQFTFIIGLLVRKIGCEGDTIEPRIVGGPKTTIVQHPYIVQLRDANGNTFCGGTLIAPKFAISAGHCLVGVNYQRIVIVGGTGKINGTGVKRRVAKVTIHPEYNSKDYISDLAVIEMRRPMEGKYIKALSLCGAPLRPGDVLRVSGWGKLSENAKRMPVQLHSVRLPVAKKAACKREFGRYVRKNMFCTSGVQAKGHCFGDSGGPAVFRQQLCGVVAFAYKCGVIGYQSAYTSIYPLRAFIRNVIAASRN